MAESQFLSIGLYSYPPSGFWTDAIAAAPTTGIIIANVDSGPGTGYESNFGTVYADSAAAGILVIGYVYTSYGARSEADVEADIANWYAYYGTIGGDPVLGGIFFDEVAATTGNETYYTALVNYVHTNHAGSKVMLNPGDIPAETYLSSPIGDIIQVCEDTYADFPGDAAAAPGWLFDYPSSQIAITVNTCSTEADMENAIALSASAFNAKWVWVTADDIYAAEPSYFAAEVALLASSGPSGDLTVTATQGGGDTNPGILLRVLVLDKAAVAGSPNAGDQSGALAHSVTITTTEAGSIVYGAIVDGFAGTVPMNAGCTAIDNVVDNTNTLCYATFYSGPTVTPGANSVGTDASYGGGVAALEVLPSGGSITNDGSSPAVADSDAATTITTATFTPPTGTLLIALVSAGGMSGDVTAMTVADSYGLSWTAAAQANAASNFYAGVWFAYAPADLDITTSGLPGGNEGESYSQTLSATGGYLPLTWSLHSGSLPPGLSLNSAGILSGTPATPGTYDFTAEVTDSFANAATQPLAVVISAVSPSGAVYATVIGSNGYAAAESEFFVPLPANTSLQVPLDPNTAGDWMVACISWHQAYTTWTFEVTGTPSASSYFTVTQSQAASIQNGDTFTDTSNPGILYTITYIAAPSSGDVAITFTPPAVNVMASPDVVTQSGVTFSVADDAHNWWFPLTAPSGTSSAAGVTRTAIWASPAARAANYVLIAPTGHPLSVASVIYDAAGLSPYSVSLAPDYFSNGYANASSGLSMSFGSPGQQAIVFTAAGSDDLLDTITLGSGGWSAVTAESADNGVDHTADIDCSTAWQVTSGGVTASWSATGAVDFSGVTAAISAAGTSPFAGVYTQVYTQEYVSGQSVNWPYTVTEIALNAAPGTPVDQWTWTPLTQPSSTRSRVLASQLTQGRQYTLDQLQTGQGTMTLDDPDLLLIPPGSGEFAGIDSGTPFRIRHAWPGGAWQVQFSGNGSTSTPQVEALDNRVPVSPGSTYTASAWLGCSAPGSGGAVLNLAFFTSGGSYISGYASEAVTVTQATLVTVSGEAPPAAALADYTISAGGTPAASLVFYAAAAVPGNGWVVMPPGVYWAPENGASVVTLNPWYPDRRGAPNVTPWYISQAGYFQRWPPTWDPDLYRGQVQATIADAWAYTNRQLKSCLRQEVLADGPYAYWPLSDPLESINLRDTVGASNIAPGNQNTLDIVLSKNGTGGTAEQVFGANSGGLPGDQVTTITTSTRSSTSPGMWQQSDVVTAGTGYTLQCTDSNYPLISAGVTVSCWFQSTQSGTLPDNAAIISVNGSSVILSVYIDSGTGALILSYVTSGTQYNVTVNGTDFRDYGVLSHLAVTFNQSSYNVYLDGVSQVSAAFTGTLAAQFSILSFNGEASRVNNGFFWNGYAAHAAVHPYQVSAERLASWYSAGYYCLAPVNQITGANLGEADWARVERLLGYAGYTGPRVILEGSGVSAPVDRMVSCQDIGGQPAATSLTNVAASTVPALLYVAPSGDVVYIQRSAVWNQPVRWVLGDDPAAGEIPFQGSYAPDYDPARVVNDIQITQLDDQSVAVPSDSALEAASISQYGDQTYQVTGYLQDDLLSSPPYGDASEQDLANWIAEGSAVPHLRVAQVSVDAASHPAAWPFVLSAAVGDVTTVNIRPVTAGGQLVSITGRITQTQRSLVFGSTVTGSVSCVLDFSPDISALTLNDPVLGLLNGNNVLSW